jgi:hypothetical protein
MSVEAATARVLDALNELEIAYMLVGAFSVNFHGIARSTQDADFVAQLVRGQLAAIMGRLGRGFRLDPQMSFESATGTTRHIVYYLGSPESPIRIEFFQLSNDEYDRRRFARRMHVRVLDRPAFLLTAEDVIVTKLRWYEALHRSKDKDDARGVIAVQGDRLDWGYIHHWCECHGTRELLDAVRASVPRV